MVPGAPAKGHPPLVGAVASTWTVWCCSSRISSGRVWQSASVPTVVADHAPVPGLKLSNRICGSVGVAVGSPSRLVLTTAKHPPGGVGLDRLDVQVVVGQ